MFCTIRQNLTDFTTRSPSEFCLKYLLGDLAVQTPVFMLSLTISECTIGLSSPSFFLQAALVPCAGFSSKKGKSINFGFPAAFVTATFCFTLPFCSSLFSPWIPHILLIPVPILPSCLLSYCLSNISDHLLSCADYFVIFQIGLQPPGLLQSFSGPQYCRENSKLRQPSRMMAT